MANHAIAIDLHLQNVPDKNASDDSSDRWLSLSHKSPARTVAAMSLRAILLCCIATHTVRAYDGCQAGPDLPWDLQNKTNSVHISFPTDAESGEVCYAFDCEPSTQSASHYLSQTTSHSLTSQPSPDSQPSTTASQQNTTISPHVLGHFSASLPPAFPLALFG